MPDLPLDVANWVIALLMLVAIYFLKDLRESYRITRKQAQAHEAEIALLNQKLAFQEKAYEKQFQFQEKVNLETLERQKEIAVLIRDLQKELGALANTVAANHGTIKKLEAERE